jgi:hypothetical protein
MDEYISKTKFEELMLEKARCNFDLYYAYKLDHYKDDAIGYNMAANEVHVFPAADVLPAEIINHIKHRMMKTAFNNVGCTDDASKIIEDIADRIDLWVDEFKRGDTE